ncbi:hypothetical protein [Winogradskyella sp. PE311]|uniref:hypothetical protein n=1 Tax=Winogradskyella sp. PE311 TaxID=3366943 RepID=UPI003980FA01
MKKVSLLFILLIGSLLSCNQVTKEISREWVSVSQNLEFKTDTTKKFKVVASAKVETEDKDAWAGIWARVDNTDKTTGFFDNMGNRPIKSSIWNSYVIEGSLDSKSERLNFGMISFNNGKFYFDKFELYIEDDNGVYQQIEIDNASFESEVIDNKIPDWNNGVSKGETYKVKEFSFTTNEDSTDGNYSLLIEGNGIKKSVAAAENAFPNAGMWIFLVFLLVLVFSFLTNISLSSEEKWSVLRRIGFRFSFIYFILIILFQNNGAFPFWDKIFAYPTEWFKQLITWLGSNFYGLAGEVSSKITGSGDTLFDFLVIFTACIIALIGCVVWSIIDRKQRDYDKMYYWLTVGIRYYVGLMLISYGMVKVIQLQFSSPGFYRMMSTYGESSPMGLAWTFLGFSKGYNMFMGIAEILAGLLLFRRTMTFGAIITLMTAMNVMAVNYFYDVPVKILSTHLVLMTLFLLFKDIKRLLAFFFTKVSTSIDILTRPIKNKGINIALTSIKGLLLGYVFIYGFITTLDSEKMYGSKAPKPDLYGVYEVTNFVINGDTITSYKDQRLWKNIVVQREGSLQIKKFNNSKAYFGITQDSLNNKLTMSSWSNDNNNFELNYTKVDSTGLDFNFINKGDTIYGSSIKLKEEDFLLTNRGFHWISEYPYNR